MTNTYIAIVPAAGIGSRMQADIAKQYLRLGNAPVLEHTLKQLLSHPAISQVIVALHPEDTIFQTLPSAQHAKLTSVIGGAERADSVAAALEVASPDAIALVHDAARPCVRHEDIDQLISTIESGAQAAILARQASDTIKLAKTNVIDETIPRQQVWGAQTPQAAQVDLLQNALLTARESMTVTDEASALECYNIPVSLVQGSSDNIKITYPEDLALAHFYLQQQGRLS